MPELIAEDEIGGLLAKCPAWEVAGAELVRTLEFESFSEGIDFVNELAEIAEEAGHHPDIDIRYSRVTLRLSTHEKGGLTEADFELAQRIDNFVD